MTSAPPNTPDASTARRFVSIALLASVAIAGTACGDDGVAANPRAFCDLARELDKQTHFPSADQLEDLTDAAPDPIAEEVELVADALVARGEPALGEPDVEAAIAVIEGYEVKTCQLEGDDASEKDPQSLADLTPDPDHPYCDAEEQIDATFDDAVARRRRPCSAGRRTLGARRAGR